MALSLPRKFSQDILSMYSSKTDLLAQLYNTMLNMFKYDMIALNSRDEIAEFANSVDLDEVAHNEPPHLNLHCLPSSL